MHLATPTSVADPATDLLTQAQTYLIHREQRLPVTREFETAWVAFYDHYSSKVCKYAFSCGATERDIGDCLQDVWAELVVRLPGFRLDPRRGRFDTWLYSIVRGKMANLRRAHKRDSNQFSHGALENATDHHDDCARKLEDEEFFRWAWEQVRRDLSACNFEIVRMRLVEQRSVAEVATELGLSHEQVWYRYHRARRRVEQIWSACCAFDGGPPNMTRSLTETDGKTGQEFAQGKAPLRVPQYVGSESRAPQGGKCVDYIFQRLELGRRESSPEWKVEWNCGGVPKPVLCIRKSAIVAYGEICGCEDFINSNWPRIVNAAVAAGVAAGIATIIATPTGVLPIFQAEFYKLLQGKGDGAIRDKIQIALSAKQEANGPWCECKD